MSDNWIRCPKLPWMIDFHTTGADTIPNYQLGAAFADNCIDHLCKLNFSSQVPKRRLAGVACTIGPNCESPETLEEMMEAGMTVLRVKIAHYSQYMCKKIFETIRSANDNFSKKIGRVYPLAIGLELKGAEIRTGTFKDPDVKEIPLAKGQVTAITTDPAYEEHVTEDMIYVDYENIKEIVVPGDVLHLGNGTITLSAVEIVGGVIKCIVEKAGILLNLSNVSLPGIPIDSPKISEKDAKDIQFAVEQNVDIIFVPLVRNHETVDDVREIMGDAGKSIIIISKIESSQGLDNIDKIISASDGILIARPSLGLELPVEKLFLVQKSLIAMCNKVGKPVIFAGQPLESMTKNENPTKAEVSDIANAILDGCDCILLSRETSIGDYPKEAIEMLSIVCKEAEAAIYQKQVFQELTGNIFTPIEPIYAIAISAVEASLKCNAAAIILNTTSGRSAKIITKYRPRCPIVAITRYGHVARQLHVFRGVDPILYIKPVKGDWQTDTDNRIQLGITYGKTSGFIRSGDSLVIMAGSRPGAGFTNSLKIVYASEFDAILLENKEKKM